MQCEAILLGREPVDGAIDAVCLATLIRSLLPTTRNTTTTRRWTNAGNERLDQRYVLRCRDGLELIKRPSPHKQQSKRHDDEGFESDGDDDSASTRSLGSSADDTISNSSSCCFVDDHVFKCHPNANATTPERPTASARLTSSSTSSCVSSVATDSANSSGASDTEDTSAPPTPSPTALGTTSVAALVKSLSLFQQRNTTAATSKQPHPTSNPPPATTSKDEHEESREIYSVNEIAFCHTDPSFQRVVVWVVKKKRLHGLASSSTDTAGGLEAIVFECSSEENMKKLIQSFHETSRRFKLEQYRHPHRRKDTSAAPNRTQQPSKTSSNSTLTPESIIKALKEASQKSSTLIATAKTVTNPLHLPTTRNSSNSSGPGSEVEVLSTVAGTRFNLVQRTDGDGVTHIEVSRGLPMENPVESVISLDDDQSLGGPSSIISISTPDIGNLSTNANSGNKMRFCKEIEGVIRSDVDIGGSRKEIMQRQRQPAILVIHSGNGDDDSGGELRKVWCPPASTTLPPASAEKTENSTQSSTPPQRPERKRYARKNKAPAPPPPTHSSQIMKVPHQLEPVNNKILPFTINHPDTNTTALSQKRNSSCNNNNQQLVVKGQFIRVSVDQQQQQQQPTLVVPAIQQGAWIYGNNVNTGNLIAYSPAPTSWGIPVTVSHKHGSNKNHAKIKDVEDPITNNSSKSKNQQPHTQQHYRKNRSRSRNLINGSHRSKSPPARRPMAYRYIDTVPASNTANSLSNRFFGLSQKLREIGGAVVNSSASLPYIETARRRNSIGDLPARFECLGEGCGGGTEGKNAGNLKSVIKKNRRIGEYSEPKKVTFSAYATVQVVD